MPVFGIGAWVYRMRRRFQGGLRATWYRERVRPRILETPSILVPDQSAYEIHTLTSSGDWLNLIWALKSFYHFSGETPALCIHEDGSLDETTIMLLAEHFPGCRIIRRTTSDKEIVPEFVNYPKCLALRGSNHLALKVIDTPYYAQAETILLLDSDVLFFREPTELLERLHRNSDRNFYNRDIKDSYTTSRQQLASAFNLDVAECFNSGLCILQAESLNLDWMEEFLSDDALKGHFWLIEQTLIALCSSRFGTEPLPKPYDVCLNAGLKDKAAKHYVGAIRADMYREGMKSLNAHAFLERIGKTPRLTTYSAEVPTA